MEHLLKKPVVYKNLLNMINSYLHLEKMKKASKEKYTPKH